MEIALAVAAGPFLWLAGALVFDGVHWVLHLMLRSRWRVLRALAWPHAVHHRWIDRELRVQWRYQWPNVFCHLIPEYATQLAFTGLLALVLPTPYVVVVAVLQTGVFLGLLSQRGLDVNHRPVEVLDAYRPGLATPPAYHALHHVYPDAHFSAYTKVVDALVGGAAQLAGRRFVLMGGATPFGRALRGTLARVGVDDVREEEPNASPVLGGCDVLVLCDPELSEVTVVESFLRQTRRRRLPPEVWVVHRRPDLPVARYYHGDVRVLYRTLVADDGDPAGWSEARARSAARATLFWIRRGFHYVPMGWHPRALGGFRRFRRTEPARPRPAPTVRHRLDWAGAA